MEPDEIKALIEASGLKIGEIESQIGLAQSTLSKVIKGTRSLNAKKLSALKRICNKAIKERVEQNNLPENKEQIEKDRNKISGLELKNPLTPEEAFNLTEEKAPKYFNTVAEALNSTQPPVKAEGTITQEDLDDLFKAVKNSQQPAPEVPEEKAPEVKALAEPPNNPLLLWEDIEKRSQEFQEIYDLGQRFKTLCEAITKNPEDVLNDISNRWIADTPPVVIAHEDDVREFPRPDSSLFKFL